MKVSDFGLNLIKAFEGFSATVYRCPAGVLTQGYGHTANAGSPPLGGTWTKEFASKVLRATVDARYAAPVSAMLKRTPTQWQFDALVSLAYNIGVGAFQRSTVLARFNKGDDNGAASAFSMWTKAAGKVQKGLVRRRASEALIFTGVKDENFDGVVQRGEAAFGPMPQKCEQNFKPAAKSKTVQGASTAAAGGLVLLTDATAKLTEADGYWSSGTVLGYAIGAMVVGGAAWTLYSAWRDRGSPLPWRHRDEAELPAEG